MAEPWTGPKFGHLTFNCNIYSSFTKKKLTIVLEPFPETL